MSKAFLNQAAMALLVYRTSDSWVFFARSKHSMLIIEGFINLKVSKATLHLKTGVDLGPRNSFSLNFSTRFYQTEQTSSGMHGIINFSFQT